MKEVLSLFSQFLLLLPSKSHRNRFPRSVIRLTSLSGPSIKFHLYLSEDRKSAAVGLNVVGVALSERADDALLDWITIDRRVWVVGLKGSWEVNSGRSDRRNLLIVSAYAPTGCSSGAMKDTFYQKLYDLFRTQSQVTF